MTYSIQIPKRAETKNEQLFRQIANTEETKQREATFKSQKEQDNEILDL